LGSEKGMGMPVAEDSLVIRMKFARLGDKLTSVSALAAPEDVKVADCESPRMIPSKNIPTLLDQVP
jgi:hypothetical protein